ncbi:MAG: hypothetical protein ACI9F2_000382, partial [Lysobacterales bacterium]
EVNQIEREQKRELKQAERLENRFKRYQKANPTATRSDFDSYVEKRKKAVEAKRVVRNKKEQNNKAEQKALAAQYPELSNREVRRFLRYKNKNPGASVSNFKTKMAERKKAYELRKKEQLSNPIESNSLLKEEREAKHQEKKRLRKLKNDRE